MRAALEMHRTFGYFEEREPKVLENSARTSVKWSSLLVFLFEVGVSEEPPCATLSAGERSAGGFFCPASTLIRCTAACADSMRAATFTLYGVSVAARDVNPRSYVEARIQRREGERGVGHACDDNRQRSEMSRHTGSSLSSVHG